jgi:phage terminase small subunit
MALLTPDMRRALGEFTVDEYKKGRGENAVPVTKMKIKMADKLRALEMLGKHLGIFTDVVRVDGDADLIERLLAGRRRVGEEESESEVE